MKKNNLFLYLGLAFVGLLVAYSFVFKPKDKNEQAFLEKYNLTNKSVEEMTVYLDSIVTEPDGFFGGIKAGKLTIGDDTNEYSYNVPNNKFYLSLAPYINNTHPCANHNVVTCRGELKNVTMHVLVKDDKGNVIVDKDYTSFDNGFIGIWLPSGINGNITVTYNGLSATSEISTNSTSNTCLTTLKLA